MGKGEPGIFAASAGMGRGQLRVGVRLRDKTWRARFQPPQTLAAVSIMREHLPKLKIRVVNVVDLMRLQPETEHPHGLSNADFDALFTMDKHVIFAFHAYPWLIHRLT